MASLALVSSTVAISSSFAGKKLSPAKKAVKTRAAVRFTAPRAKYGDESVYFDLKDLGNTTGAWDLYGSDSPSPYNGLQSAFFETFAGFFTKRGILLKLLVVGYASVLLDQAARFDGLPIKVGPKGPPAPGPNGKI